MCQIEISRLGCQDENGGYLFQFNIKDLKEGIIDVVFK